MRRRALLGITASILAIAGVLLLITYTMGADGRAVAAQQPKKVLVVTKEVPMATAAKALASYVEVREVPKSAVVAGAVTSVDELAADNVTSTTLKIGEQVLAARFVAPTSDELINQVAVPDGLQQLTIQLEPQRVVGSILRAGDKVGVYVTLTTGDVPSTSILAHSVLVLRTQGATTASSGSGEKAPTGEVLVTVAVDTPLSERIIFARETGKVYLTKETGKVNTDGSRVVQAGNVLTP